jgi:hypothetical protein
MSAMHRIALAGAMTLAGLSRRASAEEQVDAEFLDYLGSLEGRDEDWTWFSEDAVKHPHEDESKAAEEDAR